MNRYQVQVFAVLRDAVGAGTWHHESPERLTAPALLAAFFQVHPQVNALRDVTRLAVNHEFVTDAAQPLATSDELALIPPVSGG